MLHEMTTNTEATAVASGLMVAALIDLLIEKGLLSRDDVARALEKARQQTGTSSSSPVFIHGPDVIAGVMRQLPAGR